MFPLESGTGGTTGDDLLVETATRDVAGRSESTLWLHGDVCAGTTPLLAEVTARLLDAGSRRMRYDLRELRLCTSDGIEVWLQTLDRLRPIRGELVLDHANRVVRRVLGAVGTPELQAAVSP